ncbi:MAG: hypothetical protein V2A56_10290 [bacterium]
MKRQYRWMPLLCVLLTALIVGWIGCGQEKGIITEVPDTHGVLSTESTCVSCHTDQNLIEETTDYVPPAEGSSGEG